MDYGIYESGVLIARFTAPLTVRSNQPIFSSDTLSLKRTTSRRTAHRWEIEANLEPLTSGANDLFVNLVTKGFTESVTISMPQNYGVILKRTSVSTPAGTGDRGATTVDVTGNTGLIPAGTFVRFPSHSKIYITTADLSGSGTMHVYPALRDDATGGVFNHRDDVMMPCLYDTDTISGMVYTDGILMDIGKVKLIERL
jgi:hypothetical protein